MKVTGPHQKQRIVEAGVSADQAQGVMILVHGRGASAESILGLGEALGGEDLFYRAPQAANYTWYPHRFIAPIEDNEPHLSSALHVVENLVADTEGKGFSSEKIILGGFSQGACLVSEFVARNPKRYGALLVFSGGLIGPPGGLYDYTGDLKGTPVFLGCSDVDMHIPLERVEETAEIMQELGADVTKKIYPGMPHTIIPDEIKEAQKLMQRVAEY